MKIAIFTQGVESGTFLVLCAALCHAFEQNGVEEIDVLYIVDAEIPIHFFPAYVKFNKINAKKAAMSVIGLATYLKDNNPNIMISMPAFINIPSIIAKLISGWKGKLIITEHATMSFKAYVEHKGEFVMGNMPTFAKLFYRFSDALVGVSAGVIEDLRTNIGVKIDRMVSISNPVNSTFVLAKSEVLVDIHPWLLSSQIPCFVAVGRLVIQKDFVSLLEAFSIAKKKTDIRLLIIGDGPLRSLLQKQIQALSLENFVQLLGFVDNPYPYMKRSSGLVLSSVEEAFGLVIVEALVIGIPVVAVDSIGGGPREILNNGEYGILVPSNNVAALAHGMLSLLEPSKSTLFSTKAKKRADFFSCQNIGKKWINFIESL